VKLSITPTNNFLTNEAGNRVGRIWVGESDKGVKVHVVVATVIVPEDADNTEFERELEEMQAPARFDVTPNAKRGLH
jgi:hypothetical protein